MDAFVASHADPTTVGIPWNQSSRRSQSLGTVSAYAGPMLTTGSTLAASSCTSNRGNAALGLVILALLIGSIVLFAVLNAQARGKLAVANSELAYLRPEVARLRTMWGSAGPGPSTWPTGSGWFLDPAQRHEYRKWTGDAWSDDVSDGGALSKDPITDWRS
jgi:hypothetical protein